MGELKCTIPSRSSPYGLMAWIQHPHLGEASIKGSCLKDCDLFMGFSEWVMENV